MDIPPEREFMNKALRTIAILMVLLVPMFPGYAQTADQTSVPPSYKSLPVTESGSVFTLLVKDVGRDYKNFFSKETAIWYGGGLAGAGLIHLADESIRESLADIANPDSTALKVGEVYGNLAFQVPMAIGWWAFGHALGSSRAADAGRDLLRAQINSASWTYALKYAVNRDRPNGEKRSFPSGHASATFATAMVLQEHYGWKVGVPFFIGAGYTAITRINNDKHWASDVVFGAAVGIASGRTVTLHLRKHKITLVPVAVPGGAGFAVLQSN